MRDHSAIRARLNAHFWEIPYLAFAGNEMTRLRVTIRLWAKNVHAQANHIKQHKRESLELDVRVGFITKHKLGGTIFRKQVHHKVSDTRVA